MPEDVVEMLMSGLAVEEEDLTELMVPGSDICSD